MAIKGFAEWQTYTDHEYGYGIEYPSRWSVDPPISETLDYMDREIRSDDIDYYTPTGGTFSISKPCRNSIGDIGSIISYAKNKTIEDISRLKILRCENNRRYIYNQAHYRQEESRIIYIYGKLY